MVMERDELSVACASSFMGTEVMGEDMRDADDSKPPITGAQLLQGDLQYECVLKSEGRHFDLEPDSRRAV